VVRRVVLLLSFAPFPAAAASAQVFAPRESPTYQGASASARPTHEAVNLGTRSADSFAQTASEDAAAPSFLQITLAAGAGAVAGGTAAAFAGVGSGARGSLGALVIAGFVGGGTVGAGAATKRWEDSFVASLLGTAGALLAATGVDRAAESAGYRLEGFGLVVGYGLVHGAITALMLRR